MRTERKVSDKCVVVAFDSGANMLYARKPGKENIHHYKNLITITESEILVDKAVLDEFGLTVKGV